MLHKNEELESFSAALEDELMNDILPYWTDVMQDSRGGFYGHVSGLGQVDESAPKGAILNARILWTFSAAYRFTARPEVRRMAERALSEILGKFEDKEYGGVYWSLDSFGRPLNSKKQIYAIAFAIYGLSEFYRVFGDKTALDAAVRMFYSIESHSFDKEGNGYFEAFSRNWSPIDDLRLSEKEPNESKTMNTHLHILEAYTSLYRVWKDEFLASQLRNLIMIFIGRIVGEDGHMGLFFSDDWKPKSNVVSYGHEIEASWLLWEAVEMLGDDNMANVVRPLVVKLTLAASEGWNADRGMAYEKNVVSGKVDWERHWWVQAEAVVGYFNLWQCTAERSALDKSLNTWKFISSNLLDKANGEWYWSVREDGTANTDAPKAGFWKCPYHNARMCMEVIGRIKSLNGF